MYTKYGKNNWDVSQISLHAYELLRQILRKRRSKEDATGNICDSSIEHTLIFVFMVFVPFMLSNLIVVQRYSFDKLKYVPTNSVNFTKIL